jgi:hypothetical protein
LKTSGLAFSFIAAALVVSAPAANASECKDVRTDLIGKIQPCAESPFGLCAPATAASGLLKGPKSFVFQGLAPTAGLAPLEAATVLSYTGPVVYHTRHGDLHLNAIGVLDQVRLVFTEVQRVSGGTGRFAGASGNLFVSGDSPGAESSGAVPFESRVTGEICTSR